MAVVLYTEEETAEILRIEVKTLRNLRRRRKIQGFRQSNKWFYRPEYIENYIQLQEKKSCVANPNSLSSKISKAISSPIAGISNIMTTDAVNASLLGSKLARKTMKQT